MANSQRLKGKWALGIEPRHFTWVLRDRLAVCERLGGYGDAHRRVRRQEEIIWTKVNGFDRIVSLIPNTANLHNYDEEEVSWVHRPFRGPEDGANHLAVIYADIHLLVGEGFKLIMHREELGEHVSGLIAGYLVWTGMVEEQTKAIVTVEQLLSRPIGPVGREIVALAARAPQGDDIERPVIKDEEAEDDSADEPSSEDDD